MKDAARRNCPNVVFVKPPVYVDHPPYASVRDAQLRIPVAARPSAQPARRVQLAPLPYNLLHDTVANGRLPIRLVHLRHEIFHLGQVVRPRRTRQPPRCCVSRDFKLKGLPREDAIQRAAYPQNAMRVKPLPTSHNICYVAFKVGRVRRGGPEHGMGGYGCRGRAGLDFAAGSVTAGSRRNGARSIPWTTSI